VERGARQIPHSGAQGKGGIDEKKPGASGECLKKEHSNGGAGKNIERDHTTEVSQGNHSLKLCFRTGGGVYGGVTRNSGCLG